MDCMGCMCSSWQRCAACGAVRSVLLHNGLPGHQRPLGFFGHHSWASEALKKNGDDECEGKP